MWKLANVCLCGFSKDVRRLTTAVIEGDEICVNVSARKVVTKRAFASDSGLNIFYRGRLTLELTPDCILEG